MKLHNAVQRTNEWAGHKTQSLVQREPAAADLLRNRYTTADCRALFPSNSVATVAQLVEAKKLRARLDEAMDLRGPARSQQMADVREDMAAHASVIFWTVTSINRDTHNAGVRPETAIVFGGSMDEGKDSEYLVDVTGLSEVSHGHRDAAYRHIVKLWDEAINPCPAPAKGPSPVMTTDEKAKRRKYSGLMEAVVQHVTVEVQWRAFVFTWLGTLADEAEDLIAAILKQHLDDVGGGPTRARGGARQVPTGGILYPPGTGTGKEYRDRIAVAIARGVGRMLVGAGHAWQR
jgi:hypothetical protein